MAFDSPSGPEAPLPTMLALLDTLFAHLPVGIAVFSPDLRYLRINARLALINDLPVAAHLGHSVYDVVPHIATTLVPLLEQVLATGHPIIDIDLQGPRRTNSNQMRFARASYYPIQDQAGQILGVVSIVQDTTEQMLAAAALQESQSRYRELIEHATDIIYVLDLTGRVLDINSAGERLLGYRRDELLAQPIARLVMPEYLAIMEQMLTRKMEGAS